MTSILTVSAAVPTLPPTGWIAWWYFSRYFQNIASTPVAQAPTTTCGSDSIIIGFYTTPGLTFLTPQCRNISQILSSYASNIGIGTAANVAHKLSVAGKIRVTTQTVVGDTDDTVATKKYVDDNAGGGGGPVNFSCPAGQFVSGFSSTGAPLCTGPSYLYNWEVNTWWVCSLTCGGGTQNRTVRCKRNDGYYVSDAFCGVEPKPVDTQACNTGTCGYRIQNFTTGARKGYVNSPLWIHSRCVVTNVWADWNDKTAYNLGGSDNANWSIGISDEWGGSPAYANVMCTDPMMGWSPTDGELCTYVGLPGIRKGAGCYVGTYYSDRYSTYLNNITNSAGRWWAGVGTPP